MSIAVARKYGAGCGKCNTGYSIVIYYGKINLIFELIHQMQPNFNEQFRFLFFFFWYQFYPDSSTRSKRDGSGSTEATEMILNNLFYITTKYPDSHTREIEEIWGTLCQFWPNNLKVILRYLVIVSGMAPNELLPFVS